jgi:hypothetical protein
MAPSSGFKPKKPKPKKPAPRLVSDRSIRQALEKALKNDGRLTLPEMESLFQAAFDRGEVTRQERFDLLMIAEKAHCDTDSIVAIYKFLELCNAFARKPWSFARLRQFYGGGKVPPGWFESAYGKTGQGPCGIQLSLALKKGGFLTFRDFASPTNSNGKHVWPQAFAQEGLPVNAKELADYLALKLGPGNQIDINDPLTGFRQGIIYMTGFSDASGHVTLWNGNQRVFEDGRWFSQVETATNTRFWDMRPDWLVK